MQIEIDEISKEFGTTAALTEHAAGLVWLSDTADATARLSWRTGDGQYRLIGQPPKNSRLAAPTIEDAYLLLIGRAPSSELAETGVAR